MRRESWRSSKNDPCPICQRTKDGDCSIKDYGNTVFCHTYQADESIDGWKFIKEANGGAGWGLWLKKSLDNPFKPKKENVTTYNYDDRHGNRLIQVVRDKTNDRFPFYQLYWDGSNFVGKKNFPDPHIKQSRESVPIYDYLRVREAIDQGKIVCIVEGEKCVEALKKLNIVATTSIGGSNSFSSWGDYSKDLAGASLLAIFPDMDQKGWDYAQEWKKLYPNAVIVKCFPKSSHWNNLPDDHGFDIADWIAEGHTKEEIRELIRQAKGEKDADQMKTVEGLKSKTLDFLQESDPFAKALLENAIRSEFHVSGRRLDRLVQSLESSEDGCFVDIGDCCVDLLKQIEEQSQSETVPGYFSGLPDLDEITGGFQAGDLIILAARPSMGKTALALNIGQFIAENYPETVAIFSLEMSRHQLVYRLLSGITKYSTQTIRNGKLTNDQWVTLSHAVARVSEMRLSIDDTCGVTISAIRQKLTDLSQRHQNLSVVMIDYLQLLSGESGENRTAELSQITRGLKIIAREFNCALVCLSQLSRAVESRSDKRPILSDLRDSGSIEQDADQVLMLYRDDYYNPNSDRSGETEIGIVKNRNGPVGSCSLLFDKYSTTFKSIQNQYYA